MFSVVSLKECSSRVSIVVMSNCWPHSETYPKLNSLIKHCTNEYIGKKLILSCTNNSNVPWLTAASAESLLCRTTTDQRFAEGRRGNWVVCIENVNFFQWNFLDPREQENSMENKIKAGYSENEKYPNFVRWVKNEQKKSVISVRNNSKGDTI